MSEEQSLPVGAGAVPEGVETAVPMATPVEGAVGGQGEGEPATPAPGVAPSLPPPSKLPGLKPSGIKPPSKIGRICDGKPKVAPLPPTPSQNGLTGSVIRKLSDEPSRTKFSDASVVLTEDTDSFIIGDRVWVGGTKPGHIAYIGDTQFAPGDWAGIVLDEPIGKNDGSVGGIRYFQCEPKKGIFSRLTRLTRYPLTDAASIIRATSVAVNSSPPPPVAASTPLRRTAKSPTGSVASVRSSALRSPIDGNSTLINSPEPKIGERVIVMSGQTGSKAGVLRYKGPTDFAAGEWCGVELDDPLGKNDGSVAGRRYFICEPNFGLFAPAHKVSRSPAAKRLSSANCQIHRPGRHGSRESLTSSIVSAGATSIRSSIGGVSTAGSRMRLGVNSLATKQKPASALRTSHSSTVRPSPQDIVKAKDAEITQLRKERDLERAEITRAATQAEEAERKLAIVRDELDKVKEKAQQEKAEIQQQMEEMQFRMEEESITRAELQKSVESQEERLKQLDQQLQEERKQVARLQSDSDKLFETEEALARLQSDIEAATKRDESSGAEHSHLTQKIGDLEQKLNEEVERITSLLNDISTKNNEIEALKTQITSLSQSHGGQVEVLSAQLSESHAAIQESKSQLDAALAETSKKENLIKNLEKAVTETKQANVALSQTYEGKLKALANQLKERDTQLADSSVAAETLKAEIADMCAKIAAKEQDLVDTVAENSAEISKLNKIITELKSQIVEKETAIRETAEVSSAEVSQLSAKISALEKELADEKESFNGRLLELESSLKEKEAVEASLKTDIESKKAEIEQSAARTEALEEELLEKEALLKERLDSVAKEQSEKIDALKSELIEKISAVENLNANVDTLEKQILELQATSSSQIQALEGKLSAALASEENLKAQLTETSENLKNVSECLEKAQSDGQLFESASKKFETMSKEKEQECELLKKEILDLKKNLALSEKTSSENVLEKSNLLAEAQSNIQRLEKDVSARIADLEEKNTLIAGLQESKAALQTKLDTFQSHAAELELKLGDSERKVRASEERCTQLVAAKTKLEADITSLMTSSSDSSAQLNNVMADLREKERVLDEERQKNADSQQTAERLIQEKLLELDRVNDLLQKTVSEKEALDETLKTKITAAQEREQLLATQIQSQESAHKTVQEEVTVLRTSLADLSSQLQNSQTVVEQQQQQLKEKAGNVEELSQRESLLKQECEKSRLLLDDFEARMKELESKNEDEVARAKALEDKLAETLEKLSLMTSMKDKLDEAAKGGEELVGKTRVELEGVRKDLEEKENLLEAARESKAALEKSAAETHQALERSQKLLEETQLLASESRQEVEKLTSRLSDVEQELKSQLELAVQQGSEKEASLAATLASREKNILELRQNFEKLEASKAELQSQLASQTSERQAIELLLKETQDRLEALTKEKQSIESSESERKLELKASSEELRVAKEKLLNLQDTIIKKEEICEELKLSLANVQKEREELVDGLTKGKDISGQLEEKLRGKEKAMSELQELVGKLTQEKNQAFLSSQTAGTEMQKLQDNALQQKKQVEELNQQLQKQSAALQESHQKWEAENKEKRELTKLLVEAENRELNSSENNKQQQQHYEKALSEALAIVEQQKTLLQTYTANEKTHRDSLHLLESAQREKRSLEEKLAAIEKSVAQSEANANNQDPSHKAMVEERDEAQGQINFLNSVIVDLQKKNEKLQAHIELLESGVSTAEADEYNLNGLSSKMIPPRLYCDICEMFDVHDTEDCPQQCSDAVVTVAPSGSRKLPGSRPSAERPYCDNCEEFGHSTADCDETETY